MKFIVRIITAVQIFFIKIFGTKFTGTDFSTGTDKTVKVIGYHFKGKIYYTKVIKL